MIKRVTYFIVAIIFFAGLFWLLSRPPQSVNINPIKVESDNDYQEYDNPDLVFYWGDGCPHCETVQKWLEDNNQQNILKINSKEVYKNKNNSKELFNTINQYCPEFQGESGIGVPTAFDPVGQKCFQGSDEIIKFLSDRLTK